MVFTLHEVSNYAAIPPHRETIEDGNTTTNAVARQV